MSDDLAATLRAIVERLERLGVPYMIVGSVAALAHGRARSTQAFELVADLDAAKLDALLASLDRAAFYVSEDAALDALRRRTLFNVIDLSTGWKVDIIPCKRREFSRRELARRTALEVLGTRTWVATVEDTIAAKLEWSKLSGGSARQRDDVRALLGLHAERIDAAYLAAAVSVLGLADEWGAVAPA